MIRHCVMLNLEAQADASDLDAIMRGLAELVGRLDGCSGFCAGPNRDYESKSPDFGYGFTFDARNPEALSAYAVHPEHQALGARLVSLCAGGSDGIMVFDIEASA